MTTEKINLRTRPRQLFEVSFCYTDGEHDYIEKLLYRASKERLEQEVRELIREFADEGAEITWTFEEQDATKENRGVDGFPRYLEVCAREIDSLDDLDIWEL